MKKSRRPKVQPLPAREKGARKGPANGALAQAQMRERFVIEYLVDRNATQAAIRAGYSPRSAHAQAHRLLKRDDIRAALAAHQQRVLQPVLDRYAAEAPQILHELALLGMSNMADYGAVDDDGQFLIDFSESTRDHFAAIQSVKTKRTVRYRGEDREEDVTTELRLAPKREALTELAKIRGMLKDGGDVVVPVRFITIYGAGGPTPEPYPDEEEAA
jgi:phage terminase small subunit